jgi:hypothetical protein
MATITKEGQDKNDRQLESEKKMLCLEIASKFSQNKDDLIALTKALIETISVH